MGRYSLGAIFDKEPAAIAGVIRVILNALVLAGILLWDEKLLASVSIIAELGLTLFVRQSVTPNSTVADIVNTPPTAAGPIKAAQAEGVDTRPDR